MLRHEATPSRSRIGPERPDEHGHSTQLDENRFGAMAAAPPSRWRARQRHIFQSVFSTEISQPTPVATPTARIPDPGEAFGVPAPSQPSPPRHGTADPASAAAGPQVDDGQLPDASEDTSSRSSATPKPPAGLAAPSQSRAAVVDDQIRYYRAWHTVTSRIALPSSVAAEDSFGTLAPESQMLPQDAGAEDEFRIALFLVLNPESALPHAMQTEDLLEWHTQQVRRHFFQHVVPLLSACDDEPAVASRSGGPDSHKRDSRRFFQAHLLAVRNSTRTLKAALRLYYFGVDLIVRELRREDRKNVDVGPGASPTRADEAMSQFCRDVESLVGNSASPSLMSSIRVILVGLMSSIVGVAPLGRRSKKSTSKLPAGAPKSVRPQLPRNDKAMVTMAREQLLGFVDALVGAGLGGERFQVLVAEIMDELMSQFVKLSYAGLWISVADLEGHRTGLGKKSRTSRVSPCIASLYDWVENHFARLAVDIVSHIPSDNRGTVMFEDVQKWRETGLGRLAAVRISELFDIVLAWPASRGGLDDLRASVTTPERRS